MLTSLCCAVVWLGVVVHFLFYFEGTTQHLCLFSLFTPFGPHHWFHPLAVLPSCLTVLPVFPTSCSVVFGTFISCACNFLFCDKFASLDYFLIISCSPAAVVIIF